MPTPADEVMNEVATQVQTARRVLLDVFTAPREEVRALVLRQPTQDDDLLRVAVAQFDPVLGETLHNTRRACEMLETAVSHGARLTVFPECAITGYNATTIEDARMNAVALDGEFIGDVLAVCARLNTFAVIGALLRDTPADDLHNAALLIGPGGVIARYDKAHLPARGADRFAAAGQVGFLVHHTPIGKIGLLIGHDLHFPEAARTLALRGVEIVAAPCAWTESDSNTPEFVVRARAFENRVFVLAGNRVGEERGARYIGRSCIVAPNGTHLANAYPDEAHIIIADINLGDARHKPRFIRPGEYEGDWLSLRRPDLYDD